MRFKKATYIANILFILMAGIFLVMISMFPDSIIKLTVGPGYYPTLVCFLLIGASVASILKTYKYDKDHDIPLPKLHNAILIIGVVTLFLVFWHLTGQFYIVSFFAMGVLLYFLNPQPNGPKKIGKSVLISLSMQGFIYVVFQRLMYFNF